MDGEEGRSSRKDAREMHRGDAARMREKCTERTARMRGGKPPLRRRNERKGLAGMRGRGHREERNGEMDGEEGYKNKTYKTLLNGCSVKNAMSARPVNLPVSKLTVTCQSEPSPRSGKQPFKRHKQKNGRREGTIISRAPTKNCSNFLAARAKICSNFDLLP